MYKEQYIIRVRNRAVVIGGMPDVETEPREVGVVKVPTVLPTAVTATTVAVPTVITMSVQTLDVFFVSYQDKPKLEVEL